MTTIEKTFVIAFNNAEIGVWDIDISSREVTFCEKAKTMFGFAPENAVSLTSVLHRISSAHRFPLFEKIRAVCYTGGRFHEEILIAPDSQKLKKWLQVSGQLFTNEILQKKQFVGTLVDITPIKEDEARRNDLMATISHELKSPLTTIKLYIQLVEKMTAIQSDELLKSYLNYAVKEVDSIERLVESFLDVSSMATGEIRLRLEYFDAPKLIEELLGKFKVTAPNHRFQLESGPSVRIFADYFKLQQAVNNLVSNAVKYSPEHTLISLTCLRKGESIRISVRDNGIGISEENQQCLFQRFYRVDQQFTKRIKGHGLGLFITRCIVEQHGGRISVESMEGMGSEFTIELPLK